MLAVPLFKNTVKAATNMGELTLKLNEMGSTD